MCSGQGSQYYHMGKDLYDAEPVFRGTMDSCSEILRPMIGLSLSELLYRPRANRFAPFPFWKSLGLPAFAVLSVPGFDLLERVGDVLEGPVS